MKKIIYISLLVSLLFSCTNNESKISNEKLDDKNDSSNKIIGKDSLKIKLNGNASKTPIQELDTLDSLIILFFPNADKDSLIASLDSAIFSFFNEVQPPLNEEEKKKLEKEKHELYQKINHEQYNWGPNGFNEESWKQNDLFEYVELGDAEDGRIFNQAVYWLFVRLAKVSFGKEKEVYLNSIVDLSIRHADEAADYPDKLIALKELLRFQIHQKKPVQKYILKDMSELYLEMIYALKYYTSKGFHYSGNIDIIYLKRLLDLYYSGELNKHIIRRDSTSEEKSSISDTIISNEVQFNAEEKNMLSNLLSESSIVKLEQALKTLYSTDKDWEVIQSFIELAAIKDSLNLLVKDEDEEFGIESILLEKSGIGFKNCHIHDEYQCGFTISFDVYSERASLTSGKADDDFFDFLPYHSEGALHDNDKFGAWMAGADFYRTWFLGEGAFLNYFKKETALVKKHKIYDEAFSDLSTEHIKDLKKIIENIHDDAIDYLFYDPRKKDNMGLCCNKNEVIEELNQILAANVLSESENKKLKIHIEDLSNDNSPWLQWSFDNE